MINGYSTEAKVAGRLRVTCQYYQRIVCLRQIVGTHRLFTPVCGSIPLGACLTGVQVLTTV